jgi:hypothetical protein
MMNMQSAMLWQAAIKSNVGWDFWLLLRVQLIFASRYL